MNRAEALRKLRTFAGALRARGATSLYLFGSTAKNKVGVKGDLDLFIDYDPRGKFNAFDLVASKRLFRDYERSWVLRSALERGVEVISEASRHLGRELKSQHSKKRCWPSRHL
jgi:predicted nucleotidyltransferase